MTQTSPRFESALSTSGRPLTSIGPFGLSPDVRMNIRIDKSRRKYTINETDLASKLNDHKIRPEGHLSEFSEITLNEDERRKKHIPYYATEFAFMYPLPDLSTATDDSLYQCLAIPKGASQQWPPHAAALFFGAFVYLDKNRQVVRINALVDDEASESYFVFQGPFTLMPVVKARLSENQLLQPLTFQKSSGCSASHFVWLSPNEHPELGVDYGAFAYTFDNDSLDDVYFRLCDGHVLSSHRLNKARPKEETDALEGILHATGGFTVGYPATNKDNVSFSLQNQVPYQLRLATAFLQALGRDPNNKLMVVKTGKGHYEFKPDEPEPLGMLWVSLCKPLHTLTEPFVWSSKNAEFWLRQWYSDSVVTDCLKSLPVNSLEDIFGAGEYSISPDKLKAYEKSTQILTGPWLPPAFYRALVALTSDPRFIQYFWASKSRALSEFLKPPCDQDPALADNVLARDALADLLWRAEYRPVDFEFKDAAHLKKTLEQSLTELSTGVVISQQGEFLVGNLNQIAPHGRDKEVPILFLATAAIDFDEPDRNAAAHREEARYFTILKRAPDGTVKGTWKSEEARAEFKQRIKIMYDMLFTACQRAGVTYPSFLPIGLGIFLPRIESSSVKTIYHEAQFELLSEKDYGFEYYFLNPGPGRKEAEEIFGKYRFLTEVLLHSKNGKFLASELARGGFRTCCLNPSDYIAMMSGCLGYWWEVGKASRYVGEEDIVATSTLVLASKGISTAYDSARVQAYAP